MCCCLWCATNWGPGLQPRLVPWLGIKPVTLWFTGWNSVHWATPARTTYWLFSNMPLGLYWNPEAMNCTQVLPPNFQYIYLFPAFFPSGQYPSEDLILNTEKMITFMPANRYMAPPWPYSNLTFSGLPQLFESLACYRQLLTNSFAFSSPHTARPDWLPWHKPNWHLIHPLAATQPYLDEQVSLNRGGQYFFPTVFISCFQAVEMILAILFKVIPLSSSPPPLSSETQHPVCF